MGQPASITDLLLSPSFSSVIRIVDKGDVLEAAGDLSVRISRGQTALLRTALLSETDGMLLLTERIGGTFQGFYYPSATCGQGGTVSVTTQMLEWLRVQPSSRKRRLLDVVAGYNQLGIEGIGTTQVRIRFS